MRRLLPAVLLVAAACGDVANPDPVAPGAPLTAAQVERAVADLVPSDAVGVFWVRSLDSLDALGAAAREMLGTPVPEDARRRLAEGSRLPPEAIDPALPVAVAVSVTEGPPQAARLTWIVPLFDAADAERTTLTHAVHGRYVGVADDPAYGRGGGSDLAVGLPGAAGIGGRVDLARLEALLGPQIDLGFTVLPRLAGSLGGGAGGQAWIARVAGWARRLLDAGRDASLEVSLSEGAFHLRGTYRTRAEGAAPPDVGDLWDRLPPDWPLAFAGPVDPGLLPPDLPPPWSALLRGMGQGGPLAVAADPRQGLWCAVLRPGDAEPLDALRDAIPEVRVLREDAVVVLYGPATGRPPTGRPRARSGSAVALFRIEGEGLAALSGFGRVVPRLRTEGRVAKERGTWTLHAVLAVESEAGR